MSVLLSKLLRPVLGVGTRLAVKQQLLYVPHKRQETQRFASKIDRALSKPMITWRNVVIVGTCAAVIVYFIRDMRLENERRRLIQRKKMLGKAAIGGPFELVDSDGKLRTSEEFKGQWILIYFGFTHCPDICPDEIEKMVKVVDIIEKNHFVPNVQPIFISVDPERDTPELVGKYIKEYSPKFIGLTGDAEQVDKVCKAYRVYYSAGPPDEQKDYIVDHTIITYLVNPDGEFVDYYGQTRVAEEMAGGIELQMLQYDRMKKAEQKKSSSIFPLLEKEEVVMRKAN